MQLDEISNFTSYIAMRSVELTEEFIFLCFCLSIENRCQSEEINYSCINKLVIYPGLTVYSALVECPISLFSSVRLNRF